ncbi:hypothetical protein [Pseudomonas sp.]|uniref:hypothetical protein n=1 Tax=Pseudomonas sp. TaxID=306 RepID=UPI00290F0182|nr:hypothetical protein [Pseudomonas sp.]MDU4254511.1 hypothetical protein [Pseudomonas sp.]
MALFDPDQTADKLILHRASVEGFKARTVRLADGKFPLCTSTYNYSQDEETKAEIARRVAALWNLAAGIPTAELEALDASGFKLRK